MRIIAYFFDLSSECFQCWSCYEMEGSVRDPARRDITNPHIIRHFGYTDGPEGSVEEDFHTLHQFDHYVVRFSLIC